MTNKSRIIEYLMNHPQGIDDDELTAALNLKYRQQANSICRELEKIGVIKRIIVNGKFHNFYIRESIHKNESKALFVEKSKESKNKMWFWEGNVQQRIVDYLKSNGFSIIFVADTSTRQRGVDIVSKKGKEELWITVKGYPTGTKKTNPSTQASHWFKQAIFDVIDYRNQSDSLSLGIGLPNFPRYQSMTKKTSWIKSCSGFHFYWVDENGDVSVK